MTKKIILEHDPPGREKPFFMAPVGMYLNRALRDAGLGDTIVFSRGWRREERRLVRICTMTIRSSVCAFMMKSLYGADMTIRKLTERWMAQSLLSGHGRHGVDPDVCLLGEIEPL